MKQKLLKHFSLRAFALTAMMLAAVGAWAEGKTYQHVFNAKPGTGNSVALSDVNWNITATSLGNYNSANYAGVQIGTSKANGSITLTSSNEWGSETGDYKGLSKITEVRLWLNLGGTSVTPSVTIGGKAATSDGTTVVKNSSAGSDYTKATKVTFTPAADGNTGVVVINVTLKPLCPALFRRAATSIPQISTHFSSPTPLKTHHFPHPPSFQIHLPFLPYLPPPLILPFPSSQIPYLTDVRSPNHSPKRTINPPLPLKN